MNVDVLDESDSQCEVAGLVRLCRFVMRRMRLHPATELCVRLVDIDTITTLNEQWMDDHGPTDVLSFPMDELRPGDHQSVDISHTDRSADVAASQALSAAGQDHEDQTPYLGDIALCPQIAAGQAPAAGHSADDEIDLLLVHGILHLLGFDHAEPEEHARMFGLQSTLLIEWQQTRAGAELE